MATFVIGIGQLPTLTRLSSFPKAAGHAGPEFPFFASMKLQFVTSRNLPGAAGRERRPI